MKTILALVAATLLAAPALATKGQPVSSAKPGKLKKVSSAKPGKLKKVSSAKPSKLVLNYGLDGTPFYSTHRVLSMQ